MSAGNAGSRNQACGLATAIDPEAEERVVDTRWPWSWLPPSLFARTTAGITGAAPPWPDLLISCGRRAGLVAMAIRRAHPETLTVHIEKPPADAEAFDLVIALPHDRIAGRNVRIVDTALHPITPAALAADGDVWRQRFAALPHPLTGLLIGGSTKRRPFTVEQAERLIADTQALRCDGGLVITPSRRTPPEALAAVRAAVAGDPTAFLWDQTGDNPYRGILALCDRLVVTGDSVSMVSEALGAGPPVWVFDTEPGPRHARFIRALQEKGLVTMLGSGLAPPNAHVVNATETAAAAVRELLASRTKR